MGTAEFGIPTLKILNDVFNLDTIVTNYDKPSGRGQKISPSDIAEHSAQLSNLIGELNSLQASYYQETYNQPQWVDWGKLVGTLSPIEAVGQLIYTYYFYYFIEFN